jgi:ABC-type nickel/cobalt efflux system permease component RcnA
MLGMGISGGIIPCPEALGILVLAVGLNQIGLGLGLIIAFSLGIALVLVAIGVLLVRSRSRLERMAGVGGRLSVALPVVSAVAVTLLGGAMLVGAVASLSGGT